MIRLRPSGADEVLIKRVRDWYEPGPGVFITSTSTSTLFSPAMLFTGTTGVNGAWYDPSDITTLYQDAAGTTPVTAVGQPVGLMLDKSKGLVLGPELVTFASLTGTSEWSYGSNVWTLTNSTTNSQTLSVVGLTSSKWYRMVVTVSAINAGSLTFRHPNSSTVIPSSPTISTAGTYTCYFLASGSTVFLRNSTVGQTITVSSVSVRELPGNHAYNPSGNSANFPVLQKDGTGRYYLAFNGVNQWLQTNSIDFTYGDKMFVAAGVRKDVDISGSSFGQLLEFSQNIDSGANSGAFRIIANGSSGFNVGFSYESRGTTSAAAYVQFGTLSAPLTLVATGISNIASPSVILRANGTQVAQSTATQGTGNYGNYPLYIGARAGSSLWFNGRLYQMVVAGKQASAAEITSTETYLNQKTGAF